MQYQHNVPDLGLALIVFAVPNQKLHTLRQLIPELLSLLQTAPQPGTVSIVGRSAV